VEFVGKKGNCASKSCGVIREPEKEDKCLLKYIVILFIHICTRLKFVVTERMHKNHYKKEKP
jgi:hypothetical protein